MSKSSRRLSKKEREIGIPKKPEKWYPSDKQIKWDRKQRVQKDAMIAAMEKYRQDHPD